MKALTVWTGAAAVIALAAASGLADVDAITLSMARLGRTDLAAETAAHAILPAGTALAIAAGLAGLWLATNWDPSALAGR